MTQSKRKPETTDAPAPWFRIAEILQMRRVGSYAIPGGQQYYECALCLGRSADLLGEIQHRDGCPVLRVK
jgi:hypothetical protein